MSLEDTKVLKDFTTEVDEKVPAAHKLAENVRSILYSDKVGCVFPTAPFRIRTK